MGKRSTTRYLHRSKLFYLSLATLSWLALLYTIFFISPKTWVSIYYAPFFLLLILTIGFTIKTFFRSYLVSITIPLGITAILGMRLFGLKEWYNAVIIGCLTITLIYFFTVSEDSDNLNQHSSINQTGEDHADIKTSTESGARERN